MATTSVIITTHERPRLLRRAVESALAAGTRVEVLVVDDASTDETQEVCQSLQGIRYVRVERNQRVAGARNIGILESRGDYITFLDDDDVRLEGSLDLEAQMLDAHAEAGLVYGQAIVADQLGTATDDFYPRHLPQGDVFWDLLAQNFIPCGTALFRRSCLFRAGVLDESVPGIDDWDLWIRISALYPVMALEQPLMVWRKSTPASAQGTSCADELVRSASRRFQSRWMKLERARLAPARVRQKAQAAFSENMARHLMCETARALRDRRLVRACRNALYALSVHPLGVARASMSARTLKFLAGRMKGNRSRGNGRLHFMSGQPDESKQ